MAGLPDAAPVAPATRCPSRFERHYRQHPVNPVRIGVAVTAGSPACPPAWTRSRARRTAFARLTSVQVSPPPSPSPLASGVPRPVPETNATSTSFASAVVSAGDTSVPLAGLITFCSTRSWPAAARVVDVDDHRGGDARVARRVGRLRGQRVLPGRPSACPTTSERRRRDGRAERAVELELRAGDARVVRRGRGDRDDARDVAFRPPDP